MKKQAITVSLGFALIALSLSVGSIDSAQAQVPACGTTEEGACRPEDETPEMKITRLEATVEELEATVVSLRSEVARLRRILRRRATPSAPTPARWVCEGRATGAMAGCAGRYHLPGCSGRIELGTYHGEGASREEAYARLMNSFERFSGDSISLTSCYRR